MIARLRQSDFVRHGTLVLAGVVFTNVFGYLYFSLLGRRLDVEAYGVVTSLWSAVLVVGAPAIVAQLICARLAADVAARNDRAALRRLADVVMLEAAGAAIVAIALVILFRATIAAYFQVADERSIVIVAFALGGLAITSVQRGVLQGSQHFGDYSLSLSLEAATKVVVGVVLAGPLGGNGALIGIVAGALVAITYGVFACRARFGPERTRLRLDPRVIVRVISHVGIGQFTLVVLTFYDAPLVKHFFDPRAAGLYAAAALVGRAIVAAGSFVPTLVMPKAAARAAAGQSTLPLLGSAVGITAAIIAVFVVISAAAPRFLVSLIAGRAFGDAAPLVLPYVLASSGVSLAYVVSAYKMGLHRYDFVIPALLAATAEITVLSFWHPTLTAVVTILAVGHAAVFLSVAVSRHVTLSAAP